MEQGCQKSQGCQLRMAEASEVSTAAIDTNAAGRPARRSAGTAAIRRNDATGARSASRIKVTGSLIIL